MTIVWHRMRKVLVLWTTTIGRIATSDGSMFRGSSRAAFWPDLMLVVIHNPRV